MENSCWAATVVKIHFNYCSLLGLSGLLTLWSSGHGTRLSSSLGFLGWWLWLSLWLSIPSILVLLVLLVLARGRRGLLRLDVPEASYGLGFPGPKHETHWSWSWSRNSWTIDHGSVKDHLLKVGPAPNIVNDYMVLFLKVPVFIGPIWS